MSARLRRSGANARRAAAAGGAAAAAPVTHTAVGSAAAGTVSISPGLPAGFVANDFAVMQAISQFGNLNNTPSGWDQRASFLDPNSAARMKVWTRHLQAGDSAPAITVSAGSMGARIIGFRGVANPLVIEDSGSNNRFAANGGNDGVSPVNGCKCPTADPATANGLMVCCFCYGDFANSWAMTATDGAGFNEVVNLGGQGYGGYAASYRVPAAPGSYAPTNWTLAGAAPPYPLRAIFMMCLKAG